MDLGNDELDGGVNTDDGDGYWVLDIMVVIVCMFFCGLMGLKLILKVKLEDWAGFPLTTLSIWNKYKDVRSITIIIITTIINIIIII